MVRELAASRSSLIPAWRGSKGEDVEVPTDGMSRSMPHSPSLPVLVSSLIRSNQEPSGDPCCSLAAGSPSLLALMPAEEVGFHQKVILECHTLPQVLLAAYT